VENYLPRFCSNHDNKQFEVFLEKILKKQIEPLCKQDVD